MKTFQSFIFLIIFNLLFFHSAISAPKDSKGLDNAKIAFKSGQALFGAGEFNKAADKFIEAYKYKPLGAFLFNAAVCFEKVGKYKLAKKYFVKYLSSAKKIRRLSSIQTRIKLLDKLIKFEEERKKQELKQKELEKKNKNKPKKDKIPPKVIVLKPKPVLPPIATKNIVSITTDPVGAIIFLDNEKNKLGNTPFQGVIPVGKHTITIKLKGFSPLKKDITVSKNRMLEIILNLKEEAKLAWVRITANIQNADVYLDGKNKGPIGRTPYGGFIPKGKHKIFISKKSYKTRELNIDAKPGDANSYHADLKRKSIAFISVFGKNVRNAAVKIDNKVVCMAPCLNIKITSGPHVLKITKKGMKSIKKRIVLKKGEHRNWSVNLSKAPNRIGAITAYIIGVAAVGGGVWLANEAKKIKDGINTDLNSGVPVFSNDPNFKDGKIYSIGADVLFGIGALSLIVAVYRTFSDSTPDSKIIQTLDIGRTSVSIKPMFVPGGSGIAFSMDF